jgi:hypothetical protein
MKTKNINNIIKHYGVDNTFDLNFCRKVNRLKAHNTELLIFNFDSCSIPEDELIRSALNDKPIIIYLNYYYEDKDIRHLEPYGFYCIIKRKNYSVLSNIAYKKHYVSFTGNDLNILSDINKSRKNINTRFLSIFNETTKIETVLINPKSLITGKRFDILIKLIYSKLYTKKLCSSWKLYPYRAHLDAITKGVTIREYDGSNKSGIDTFVKTFNSLIDLNSLFGLTPAVTFDKDYILIDGAHRVASAIQNNALIEGIRIDDSAKNNASFNFFQKKLKPLDHVILDEAGIEASRRLYGLRLVLLFPSIINKKYAIDTINQFGDILYHKNLPVDHKTGKCILNHAYHSDFYNIEAYKNSFFELKANNCFPKYGQLTILLVNSLPVNKIRSIKDLIRSYYKIGHDSIHITDTDDEVFRLSSFLFNQNSIRISRYISMDNEELIKKLFLFREWIEENGFNPDDFVIGGSAILGLAGMRLINDIDFLYLGDNIGSLELPDGISSHSDQEYNYPASKVELITNPKEHFWYMGLKFVSAENIIQMKIRRGEKKDISDLRLFVSQDKFYIPYKIKFLSIFYPYFLKTKRLIIKGVKKIMLKFNIDLSLLKRFLKKLSR